MVPNKRKRSHPTPQLPKSEKNPAEPNPADTESPPEPQPVESSWPAPGVAFALTALPGAALAVHPLVNNDLPMHLAIGGWILDHGSIPAHDPFSFVQKTESWFPHEWLAGVIFAAVDRMAGSHGLMLLVVLLGGLLFVTMAALARELGQSWGSIFIYCLPVALIAGPRVMLRPHLLFLIIILTLVWLLARSARKPHSLFWIPALFLLWVNLHGSYWLGYVVLAAGLAVLPGSQPNSISWSRRTLVFGLALTALAGCLPIYSQPSLASGLEHTLGLVSDPVFHSRIEEWQPAWNLSFRSTVAFTVSFILVCLVGWRIRTLTEPLLWRYGPFVLLALVLTVRSQRFAALLAVAILPLLPRLGISTRLAALVPMGAGLILLSAGLPYRWGEPWRPAGWGWQDEPGAGRGDRYLPLEEVDILVESLKLTGPVLCEYHYGGVVAWRSRGSLEPSIDSRNSVYGPRYFVLHQLALEVDSIPAAGLARLKEEGSPESRAALRDVEEARTLLSEHLAEVRAVLIDDPRRNPRRRGLLERLEEDPVWQIVYYADRHEAFGPQLYVRVQPTTRKNSERERPR